MKWMRFRRDGHDAFGVLGGDEIGVHSGDMFGEASATGAVFALSDLRLLSPTAPSKVIAMWNNFHALATKLNLADPPEPLYLLKSPNSFAAAICNSTAGSDVLMPGTAIRSLSPKSFSVRTFGLRAAQALSCHS